MSFKAAVGAVSVAVLLTHGLPPTAEPERKTDECQLSRPVPIHWLRPLGADARGIRYTFGMLR
jgi:hypothetical protein